MKKSICIITVIIASGFTGYYISLGGLWGNESALSKTGLTHPYEFTIWGLFTFMALATNIIIAYNKTKYRYISLLLIISAIGMGLTLAFDFDYSKHSEYIAHCAGSLAFSAVTGVVVFLLFLLSKKYIRAIICGEILIVDLILLIVFKETALIEAVPIIAGYALLLSFNLEKEKTTYEIKR